MLRCHKDAIVKESKGKTASVIVMPYVAFECQVLEQEFSRIFPVRSITPALQIRTKKSG